MKKIPLILVILIFPFVLHSNVNDNQYYYLEQLQKQNQTYNLYLQNTEDRISTLSNEIQKLEEENDILEGKIKSNKNITDLNKLEVLEKEKKNLKSKINDIDKIVSAKNKRKNYLEEIGGFVNKGSIISAATTAVLTVMPIITVMQMENVDLSDTINYDKLALPGGVFVGFSISSFIPWDSILSTNTNKDINKLLKNKKKLVQDSIKLDKDIKVIEKKIEDDLIAYTEPLKLNMDKIKLLKTDLDKSKNDLNKTKEEYNKAKKTHDEWNSILNSVPNLSKELLKAFVTNNKSNNYIIFPRLNVLDTQITLREMASAVYYYLKDENLRVNFQRNLRYDDIKLSLLLNLERAGIPFLSLEFYYEDGYGWVPKSTMSVINNSEYTLYDYDAEVDVFTFVNIIESFKSISKLVKDIS